MDQINKLNEGNKLFRLEHRLAESLKPIRPNPAFIKSLKHKLSNGTNTVVERSQDYYGYVAIGLGLLAGAFFLWILRKTK
jgi:hypothetical protein